MSDCEMEDIEKHLGIGSKKKQIGILSALYEKHLLKKAEINNKTRGYQHFHPSAFGDCLRKMAYQYFCEKYPDKYNVTREIKPNSERIFDAGHAFHYRMQKEFGNMGILRGYWKCRGCGKVHGKDSEPNPIHPIGIFCPSDCNCQTTNGRKGSKLFEYEEIFLKSEDKYNFQGNTDGIVELIEGDANSRYIVDFKSIKSERFQEVKNSKKADKKYVVQIMIYMWLTGLKNAIIYYENKNDHELIEIEIPYSEEMVEWIKNTSEKLNKVLSLDKIPSRNPTYFKSKIPCKWCDYVKICYSKN